MMQWLPDTIDAVGRLYAQTGPWGLITVAVVLAIFILVLGVIYVLTRHTAQLVDLARAYFSTTATTGMVLSGKLQTLIESNADIAKSNLDIRNTNIEIMNTSHEVKNRVDKLPSDLPVCKAKSKEEVMAIVKEAIVDMDPAIFEVFWERHEKVLATRDKEKAAQAAAS